MSLLHSKAPPFRLSLDGNALYGLFAIILILIASTALRQMRGAGRSEKKLLKLGRAHLHGPNQARVVAMGKGIGANRNIQVGVPFTDLPGPRCSRQSPILYLLQFSPAF